MQSSTLDTDAPPRRVLVVDDDCGMTALCRRVLGLTGKFLVKEENDPLQAVETARAFRPHLILLDRKLPRKDGATIAAELSLDEKLQSVPIVFVTGQVECGSMVDGHRVLLKPFRSEVLIRMCTELALAE